MTSLFHRRFFPALSWLLLVSGGLPSFAPAAEKRAPDPQAIAEVAAGKRTEAHAAWWGFDPADATGALQAAIDSGARKLIVEDMGAPWITDKLTLASGQEIVFQKGVEVLAKRGAFRNGNDSLFSAKSKKNIRLTGDGATLRMWKQDYDDKTQYKHAEWRHVLAFWSCSGVRITGLTLADSGGDGIYLGVAQKGVPCADVTIKNVACVNNYRQGISVISARNLLIEDCVLKDTWGTAPQAGIDFEPNAATEELDNCVLRNVVSENNRGSAYAFYLPKLREESKTLSITFENCRAVGCRNSVALTLGNDTETAAVKGAVEFNHCRFEGSENEGVFIRDKPVTGAKVSFVNCEIVNAAANRPTITPIAFASRANCVNAIGGVRFSDCTITDAQDRLPMSYQEGAAGVDLSDITGMLVVKRGDQRTTHQLTPKLIAEWMPHQTFRKIAPYAAKDLGYEPVLPDSMPDAAQRSIARQRDVSEWLLWTNAGDQVSFTVFVRPVGKGEARSAPVSLISPSGKRTKLPPAQSSEKRDYEFKATEGGAYTIVCDPQKWAATVNSATHRVCLYAPKSVVHFIGTTGRYFFWVPQGTKEFAIKVSGEGSGESVKAAMFDPAGNAVEEKDNISQTHQFVGAPKDAAQGEIWSLQLDKPSAGVLEDCYVQLQGIPPLLSPTREGLLKPVK